MTRSRASAKTAGSTHERRIADCLAEHVDDRIDRRVKTGAKDRGDVGGLRLSPALGGGRVAVECKDYGGRYEVGQWLTEADTERGNDDAVAGIVIAKRRGTTDPLEQVAFMTVRDLIALLTGSRPSS